MKRSPYLYLSCARVTLSAELYKYLQTLVGKDEMAAVIALWGMAVPTSCWQPDRGRRRS